VTRSGVVLTPPRHADDLTLGPPMALEGADERHAVVSPVPEAVPPLAPRSSTALSRHLLPDTARVETGGRLSIGGLDVLDLVADVGTPVFVYDEEHLRRRCREARLPSGRAWPTPPRPSCAGQWRA
jgi:hypothetical protein